MKRRIAVIAILLALAMILTACKGGFVISGTNSKLTIKIEDAKNDAYAESQDFSVGKNKAASVTSSLEKGKLKIDFVEVVVTKDDKDNEQIDYFGTKATVTVGPGETQKVEIPNGDYVMQLTAVGETTGTVVVEIVDK